MSRQGEKERADPTVRPDVLEYVVTPQLPVALITSTDTPGPMVELRHTRFM